MKHYKRMNTYKNSTGSNEYNPVKREAWSYRWWQYVKQYEVNGRKITVFNNAGYSPTTSGHQSRTRSLMAKLGHTIDFYVVCPQGLQSGLDSSLKHYTYEINQLMECVKKPKSRRSTNLNRIDDIKHDLGKIEYMLKNKLIEFENRERSISSLELQATIYKVENFCANVLVNEGRFIE